MIFYSETSSESELERVASADWSSDWLDYPTFSLFTDPLPLAISSPDRTPHPTTMENRPSHPT